MFAFFSATSADDGLWLSSILADDEIVVCGIGDPVLCRLKSESIPLVSVHAELMQWRVR